MIRENGRVIAIKGDDVWVQTIQQSACQSCSLRSGCGQKVLASATAGRANQILVRNNQRVQVGDDVMVEIEETLLLRASCIVYGVPLVLTVLGAILGQQVMGGSDGPAIVGAALGMALGFFTANRIQAHSGRSFRPRLVSADNCYLNPTIF